jgi:hypothetical protein
VVDDALASRIHARITTEGATSIITDFDSANGTWVNGARIHSPKRLFGGDWLTIGQTEIRVIDPSRSVLGPSRAIPPAEAPTAPRRSISPLAQPRTNPQAFAPMAPPPQVAAAAAPTVPQASSLARTGRARPRPSADASDLEQNETTARAPDTFQLFGEIADKAIAARDGARAEQILSAQFRGVLEQARMKRPVSPEAADFVARYAVTLVTLTQKPAWLDGLFVVFAASRRPLPVAVIDDLEAAWRRLPGVDMAGLRAYVEVLRASAERFSPAERVLVHRIVALEQAMLSR